MNFDIRPYDYAGAVRSWLLLMAGFAVVAVAFAILITFARNGRYAPKILIQGCKGYLGDLFTVSIRRILAVTRLTLKEALRRKAPAVFIAFAVFLMFAGWFITDSNERPELQVSVHVTFLLTAMTWLILPAVIFLSCWSVPEDIRLRSMHTVVTKPVRRVEIVIGRIIGLGLISMVMLSAMGLSGLAWLYRTLPESSRPALICRVPKFGELFYLTPEGQVAEKGTNVGDVWAYRSHILGNSRARAVWIFPKFTESDLTKSADGTEELLLECRFEAFRTIKGSEKSIQKGVEAQYTLSYNPREEAFALIAQGVPLRPLADALRDGQFKNAADRCRDLGKTMRTAPDELRPADYVGLQFGLQVAGKTLEDRKDERLTDSAAAFLKCAVAGNELINKLRKNAEAGSRDEVSREEFAVTLDELAVVLEKDSIKLLEALPRIEVPVPPFHVAEYHDLEESVNVTRIPRKIRYVADYETLARYLSAQIELLNSRGATVSEGRLHPTLSETLTKDASISSLNAERLVVVLEEQLNEGRLQIADGKLQTRSGESLFAFFDDLIRSEKLVSEDPEGWKIEKDIVKDVAQEGYLRVEVACMNDQMYLGMARPDLFVRKQSVSFTIGFVKVMATTAMMLLLVVVLGVTVSCTVKGPVALFVTLTFFLVGQFFHDFMIRKLAGVEQGMGTLESAVLLAQHRNPQVGMDVSETAQAVVKGADKGLEGILWVFSNIVPDFGTFNRASAFVENRFDVPIRDAVLPAAFVLLGFLLPCVLIAGAILKFRELEAK